MDEQVKLALKQKAKKAVLDRIKEEAAKNVVARPIYRDAPSPWETIPEDDFTDIYRPQVQRIDDALPEVKEGQETLQMVEPPTINEQAAQKLKEMKERVAEAKIKAKREADDKMSYFLANREEIEAVRKEKARREAEERLAQSEAAIQNFIVDRTIKANQQAQALLGKMVRVRQIKDKLELVEDDTYEVLVENLNMKIVACPPHMRAIHVGTDHNGNRVRDYRVLTLAMPWVIFGHVWYDANNYRKKRKNRGNSWRNLIWVGFANEQPTLENHVTIHGPPLPHVGKEGDICLGDVHKDGKPIGTSFETERNQLTVDDYIAAFWNNAFVYGTQQGFGWDRWSRWTQEEIVNIDWGQYSTGRRLKSWPTGIKSYREYFE